MSVRQAEDLSLFPGILHRRGQAVCPEIYTLSTRERRGSKSTRQVYQESKAARHKSIAGHVLPWVSGTYIFSMSV